MKKCKKERREDQSTEVSNAAAGKTVPDSLFNFTAMFLCDKPKLPNKEESLRVLVDLETGEKALTITQQVLQHVGGMSTPLGIATTYHLYNQTRSKSLITLNNRTGQGISYDSLLRQLTKQSAAMMQQVEEYGVCIPDRMSHSFEGIHVFAMDNLDWTKNTLEGGSFNATTAIIIENAEQDGSADHARRDERISTPTASTEREGPFK